MPKASWNGQVIADTKDTKDFQTVESNIYFPMKAVDKKYFKSSDHTSYCPWKGTANYFHVVVEGKENKNAAWTYKSPKPAAKKIQDHVAFWKGVKVEK